MKEKHVGSWGEILKSLRKRAGLTQKELAAKSGVGITTIRDAEQGRIRRPQRGSLERLAQALGATLAEFSTADRCRSQEISLRVLGPMVATLPDGSPINLGPERQRAVLGLLALSPGATVQRETLIDALWLEDPPTSAVNAVQVLVSRLRRLLTPAGIQTTKVGSIERIYRGYRLNLDEGQLDLLAYRDLVARARQAFDGGDLPAACALYRDAMTCWRGTPLSDVAVLSTHPWVSALSSERMAATIEYADVAMRLGRYEEVISVLRAATQTEPLHEPAHARLMISLAGSGQRAAAMEVFHTVRHRLADDLGVSPNRELMEAHQYAIQCDGEDRGNTGLITVRRPNLATFLRMRQAGPAQLPLAIPSFVGRRAELRQMDEILARMGSRPGTTAICVLYGTAGVGKTALALCWAHRVAECFPDGQLYANLQGFNPAGPRDPAETVRGFLDALGVPPHGIPAQTDAQIGLYRSRLAGRRLVIVLDDALDAEQVRPLLPGSPGCLVVITSRNALPGLLATEGAHPIWVGLPSRAEARVLLASRLGERRVAAEPDKVEKILGYCGRLPLALAIVAAHAAVQPGLRLAEMSTELRATISALGGFAEGDPASDIRAAFSLSYQALSASTAKLFRHLGSHWSPDVTVCAAASLTGVDAMKARTSLAKLASGHLVTESGQERFIVHDLLHDFAAELARAADTEADRTAALRRLLDHYLHTAYAADRLLNPHRDPITPIPPSPGTCAPSLTTREQALAWFTSEHVVLLGALRQAAMAGLDVHVWQLAWSLTDFLELRAHWGDWVTTQEVALQAGQRLGDVNAQAHVHRDLGSAYTAIGRHEDALNHLEHAIELFASQGDGPGEARTHLRLGMVFNAGLRNKEALDCHRRALELYREADHQPGQGLALNNIGWSLTQLGEHEQAVFSCQQALRIQQEIGSGWAEAASWDTLGLAQHHLARYADAIDCYQHSLDLYREAGERYNEAVVLIHMGDTQLATGNDGAAGDAWYAAEETLSELGHLDAEQVHDKLMQLNARLCVTVTPAIFASEWSPNLDLSRARQNGR